MKQTEIGLAEEVRRACVEAALAAYEDGGIQGLCEEGRWELAIQRMRSLDLAPIVTADRTGLEERSGSGQRLDRPDRAGA